MFKKLVVVLVLLGSCGICEATETVREITIESIRNSIGTLTDTEIAYLKSWNRGYFEGFEVGWEQSRLNERMAKKVAYTFTHFVGIAVGHNSEHTFSIDTMPKIKIDKEKQARLIREKKEDEEYAKKFEKDLFSLSARIRVV